MVLKRIIISLLFFIQLSAISYQLSANDSSISSSQLSAPSSQQLPGNNYIDGEVIIKYKETATDSTKKALADKHSLKNIRTIKRFRLQHMKLPPGANVEAFVQKLKKERHIEYVEPNYRRAPLAVVTPNDPNWNQQWGMAKISMPAAWEINKGSPNVTVAVIDTGVDYTHPDLAGNIWTNTAEIAGNDVDDDGNYKVDDVHGWNTYQDNNDLTDTLGHGTHVAGIIGATGNNGIGVTGVNWYVKIMPLEIFNCGTSRCIGGNTAEEIEAIDYVIDKGVKIINASYGGYYSTDDPDNGFSRAEYEAIGHAAKHGILFVAAAGNSSLNNDSTERPSLYGDEIHSAYLNRIYPASYSIESIIDNVVYPPLNNIIAVAATDSNDSLTTYSNYGAKSVHLGAPGGMVGPLPGELDLEIYSTAKNGKYQYMYGTSMSTPFVAGTAALLLSQRPGATYTQIKEAILQSVDPVPALSGKVLTGGRLNAFKALQKINELIPLQIAEIPLQAGWNFISTPIEPFDPSMNTVLKDISPNVRIIWGYDNASKAWLKYSLNTQNSTLNTLDKVETGKGYWIYMNKSATLTISGRPEALSPQSVSLYNDWNLVGFSGTDNSGIDDELAKLGNDWVIVWAWTNGEWYAKQTSSLNYLTIQSLTNLSQGKAYWIKMNSGSREIQWVQ